MTSAALDACKLFQGALRLGFARVWVTAAMAVLVDTFPLSKQ